MLVQDQTMTGALCMRRREGSAAQHTRSDATAARATSFYGTNAVVHAKHLVRYDMSRKTSPVDMFAKVDFFVLVGLFWVVQVGNDGVQNLPLWDPILGDF